MFNIPPPPQPTQLNQPPLNSLQPIIRLPQQPLPPNQSLIGNRPPRNLVNIVAPPIQSLGDDGRSCPIKRSFTNTDINEIPMGGGDNSALLPTPPIQPIQFIPKQQQQQQQPGMFNQVITRGIGQQQQQQNQHPEYVNSSLVVRKIPIELNRVDRLSQHFSKFGPIVDIQCGFENNSDAALVVFGNNQAAQAAYKCPQPMFNNRFIRLYWLVHHLKPRQPQQQILPQQQQQQQMIQNNTSGISQVSLVLVLVLWIYII